MVADEIEVAVGFCDVSKFGIKVNCLLEIFEGEGEVLLEGVGTGEVVISPCIIRINRKGFLMGVDRLFVSS